MKGTMASTPAREALRGRGPASDRVSVVATGALASGRTDCNIVFSCRDAPTWGMRRCRCRRGGTIVTPVHRAGLGDGLEIDW